MGGRPAGSAVHASDEELEELADICRAAVETEDPYEFSELAMEFHRKINLLAHSPRLIRTLIGVQKSVPRVAPFSIPEEMAPSKSEIPRHPGRARVAATPNWQSNSTRSHSLQLIGVALAIAWRVAAAPHEVTGPASVGERTANERLWTGCPLKVTGGGPNLFN